MNEENNEQISVPEEKAVVATAKKVKKHVEAKRLIEEAKSIVSTSDEEIKKSKTALEKNIRFYDDSKYMLRQEVLKKTQSLLLKLGYVDKEEDEDESREVFESEDSDKLMYLKDVNSGKFTGFILSLIIGIATFVGLIYLATEALDMTLDVSKVPSEGTISNIFTWFSHTVGIYIGKEDDMYMGMGIVALLVLFMMWIFYALRVWLKAGSNLRFANKQMKDTQLYITQKTNYKVEIDRVNTHVVDAIKTVEDYRVVLNEQNGKLARIFYFEGENSRQDGYHNQSTEEIKTTQFMCETIRLFVDTPLSNEGKLSSKSTSQLAHSKDKMKKMVEKLY